MMRSWCLACFVWFTAMVIALSAQTQDDAFRAGLDARSNQKWQEVVTQMRRALQIDAQESTRKVRSGLAALVRQGGMEYLPEYFLGEALFNLQDCAGAVDAWSRSEKQGAIRGRPDFARILQDGYASCEARGVLPPNRYDPLVQRTVAQVTEANALAGTVSNLGKANIELWRQGGREQLYERATGEILAARIHLVSAVRSRSVRDFAEVSAAVERAKTTLTTLNSGLSAAIEVRNSVQAQTREVDQVIEAAEISDRAIDGRKTRLTQALSTARESGRDAITRARDRRTEGVRTANAAALTEARTLAQDASTRFKQVLDELIKLERDVLERRLGEAVSAAEQAFSFADSALGTLNSLTKEKPAVVTAELSTERDAVQRQINTTRRRFDAARKAENIPAIVEMARLASEARDRVNAMIAGFRPVTIVDRGVQPALAQAAGHFFAGEYQQALSVLDPADGLAPDVPLQLHVHLFRAAALYALYVRSRETDQSLRTQALAAVEQCKRIDSKFQPDPRAFSPRFINFFHSESGSSTPPDQAPPPRQ